MSKPMIFQNDKAFNFLKENGFVFTFREPDEGVHDIVEKVWVRRSRNGKKEFDARRIREAQATIKKSREGYEIPDILKVYVRWSGFKSADEWFEAIREFYSKDEIFGGIYLVFRVKEKR